MTLTQQMDFIRAQLTRYNIQFEKDASLAMLTTFRIGGKAALLCYPKTQDQLCQIFHAVSYAGARSFLLGCGSNTLFADEGFEGVVIATSGLDELIIGDNTVTAGAGIPLSKLCLAVQQNAFTGLQFAYGIPGSVGGAVYMNAGAYGGEMKDVVVSVRVMNAQGEITEYDAQDCNFGYRHSRFEETGEAVVSATFRLEKGDSAVILSQMKEIFARRKEKQPLEWPSAGSTFKRPQGAYAAALIEQCGLKGYTVGGAQVSEKHSGFVINRGGATCRDVVTLTDQVAQIVKERTGFSLEREIRVIR